MYQGLARIKVKSTQEKGYVLPSDDDLDDTKVTVDINGETKIYNVYEIEFDSDDNTQSLSHKDAIDWAQAVINEQRKKEHLKHLDE